MDKSKIDLIVATVLFDGDNDDNGLSPQPVQESLTNAVRENDPDQHFVQKLFERQVPTTVGSREERSKARFEEVKKAARRVFPTDPTACAAVITSFRQALAEEREFMLAHVSKKLGGMQ